ncbi:MAG: hypothetical protein Q8R49_08990 [Rhodoferax sp.]|nr:hypothetical protein [Rhodoferax sp.]
MELQDVEQVPALLLDQRATVDTATAAHYLNRRPQTLRTWASLESGPLRPRRVHGRLAWSMSEIRTLLGLNQSNGAG